MNAKKTPIAWLTLVDHPRRLLASLGGVAIASVLMFVQMGFHNGLLDSQTYVIRRLNADLFIIHRQKQAPLPQLPFPRVRVIQARGVPGVAAAYPMYLQEYGAAWKNFTDGREHPIQVFGMNPDDPVFLIPEVQRQAAALKQADTALIDSRSRRFYGATEAGFPAELSRRAVRIVGTFPLGADFRNDGSVIVSERTFEDALRSLDPLQRRSHVELGLLKVRPGATPESVQQAVAAALPSDVLVLTKQQFIDRTSDYWTRAKPVGIVFGIGMLVGFAMGVAICYQILYIDIADHLPQYATLKAMGYSNRRLVALVLQKGFYLGALGFVPGLVASVGAYAVLQWYSGIRMELTLPRVLLVFAATVAMCLVGAVIAIRGVVEAEPAEMF